MAKKGKVCSKPSSSISNDQTESKKTGKTKGKGKGKGNSVIEEPSPADIKAANKAIQQANRAKVTLTTSWTGKLPHTILHETCQKRKWNKVDYDMKKIGDRGMVATAIISYTDPKTKETLSLRMTDPTYDKVTGKGLSHPQETPMEARHIASTIALFRIAYNTNMQMMLPPNHKNIWFDLSDHRKELLEKDPKRAEILFDIDPFKTLLQDRKSKEQLDKEREAKLQQAEKTQKISIVTSILSNDQKGKKALEDLSKGLKEKFKVSKTKKHSLISFPRKVWDHAAFIDLDESTRQLVETSLKTNIDWNSLKINLDDKHNIQEREELKRKLIALEFRLPHVEEAMDYMDPLSFLLFNLPEDDLPVFFHKRKEDSKNIIEITDIPLITRNILQRLTESGFSQDEALYALDISNSIEAEAAGYLTQSVIPSLVIPPDMHVTGNESIDIWEQELDSLKSIYDDVIEIIDKDSCYTMTLIEEFGMKLKIYKTMHYPSTLPGIIISTFDKKFTLPNYIKQQILSKLLQYIDDMSLLNEMLVYHIYEWLNENLKKIIENPGRLLSDKMLKKSLMHNNSSDSLIHLGEKTFKKKRKSRNTILSPAELKHLEDEYNARIESSDLKLMIKLREALPAWKKQKTIVDLIFNNDVVLITGETGSGKSTQVVQFILDHLIQNKKDFGEKNIICTQPRRISAIGLAERVSDERCVSCGDEVGYVIRGVNKTNKNTRIKFMTTGVLVRILQSDYEFLNNSIIVIDEVHERSIDTDLVVILLKNLLGKIPGLKIILMSATVNVDVFKAYFKELGSCHIEGRTFPIRDFFLDDILEMIDFRIKREKLLNYDEGEDEDNENFLKPSADSKFFRSGQIDYNLISQVISHVHRKLLSEKNDGSVIVFLPGTAEIAKCCNIISGNDSLNEFVVIPLHSALTPDDQKRVFLKYRSKRKIVVSTNIAETSITIDDCVATIDSGRAKTMYYNAIDNTTRLTESFISKAESKQRRGRAGRVREGLSYRLYSKRLYEDNMIEMPAPEIKRVSLESLYLSVKAMGITNVKSFLAKGLDPPPSMSLEKAERMLTTLGLLSYFDNALTQLGQFISLMPVMDSKHGKLLIYSIIFGCADIGVLIVSILSLGQLPFISGIENRDKIKTLLSSTEHLGDLLSTTEILRQYIKVSDSSLKRKYMKDHFLSYNKVSEIMSSRTQYYSILKDVGFVPMNYKPENFQYLNRNEKNLDLLKSILTGAFYPNIARVELPDAKYAATGAGAIEKDPEAKLIKFWIRNEQYIDKIEEIKELQKLEGNNEVNINELPLPANRAFIHPSSILFSSKTVNPEDTKTLSEEDGPVLKQNSTSISKYPFVIFNASQLTSKLFLRDITPTSTLSLLLFGGSLHYDINGSTHSPGIILDNWLPIRTWCKNAVVIKELRGLLDSAIRAKLEKPNYADNVQNTDSYNAADRILEVVEKIIIIE